MTDLTWGYLHMSPGELQMIDTIDTEEYFSGQLSDDELEIPPSMIPPNPDESDVLPSHVHPSYPYGNPLSLKHPASRPRPPSHPASRALFQDMTYGGGGVNGDLTWDDLALDILLPVDEFREAEQRASEARKIASGGATATQQQQAQPQPQPPQPTETAYLNPDALQDGYEEEDEEEDLDEDLDEEEEEEEEEPEYSEEE